ncbi:MAG: iron(III) transport system substrate-binding protein [Gammaproteobacteria bacterium]|jgi:iron(III) transport system substrate-binding protein
MNFNFVGCRGAGFRAAVLLVAAALVPSQPAAAAGGELNVYSARKEELILPLLNRFTEKTGITVNLVTGSADGLLKRLEVEGKLSPADVFITVDAGRLHRAKAAGVLQAVHSTVLDAAIPATLRDVDRYWFGLSQRARTIFYAKDRVAPSELSTYEALADPKWKGRLCIRSSDNVYNQSLVAAMIDAIGEQKTEVWARGLVSNFAQPPHGGDTDQLKAVAAGMCDATLVNNYYFGRMLSSADPRIRGQASKLAVFWPNQGEGGRGVHMNVSGAAVTKSSKHLADAVKLLEFFVSPESQAWYAEVNDEYPVVKGVKIPKPLADLGAFKNDAVQLSRLGENNRAALQLMDRAGWR